MEYMSSTVTFSLSRLIRFKSLVCTMKSANVIKKPRKNKTVSVLRERFNLHVHHYLAVATPHGLVHLVRPKRTLFERYLQEVN